MESTSYPGNLTDQEYELIKDQLPQFNKGRPPKYTSRNILNAIC